jgi:hypothetical protein
MARTELLLKNDGNRYWVVSIIPSYEPMTEDQLYAVFMQHMTPRYGEAMPYARFICAKKNARAEKYYIFNDTPEEGHTLEYIEHPKMEPLVLPTAPPRPEAVPRPRSWSRESGEERMEIHAGTRFSTVPAVPDATSVYEQSREAFQQAIAQAAPARARAMLSAEQQRVLAATQALQAQMAATTIPANALGWGYGGPSVTATDDPPTPF